MNIVADTKQFLHEVRVELSKVVWPSREEFIGSTIVVLFLVAVFAVYFGVLDAILSQITRYLFRQFI